MLEELFTEIEHSHTFEPAEDAQAINEFEKHCGHELPDDLKEFYRRYKSVKLFPARGEWIYRFVPIGEMRITGLDIFGAHYEGDGPNSWYTICDVRDGNYIAVDLASKRNDYCNYIDCFHETYAVPGECKIIATSLAELLGRCMRVAEGLYYLQPGFRDYGDALEITPDTAIRRVEVQRSSLGWLGELIRDRKLPKLQSGWQVHFVQHQNSLSKFFGDVDYGSEENALLAAKQFLESNRRP
jgi:hypothetical protein